MASRSCRSASYDKARSVFTQGLATSIKAQALRSLALLDLYLGKYRDAKPKLNEALLLNLSGKALLSEAQNHLFMSILLEGQGDSVGVQQESDKAAKCLESLPPQPIFNARVAVGFARGRNVEKAATILQKVRKDTNPNNPTQPGEYAPPGRGGRAGPRQPGPGTRAARARRSRGAHAAHHREPCPRSAARWQDRRGDQPVPTSSSACAASQTAGSRNGPGSTHTPSLARLYLARNKGEKARRVLQQFLDLWKSADPDLQVYKEAQRLLSGGS